MNNFVTTDQTKAIIPKFQIEKQCKGPTHTWEHISNYLDIKREIKEGHAIK